MVLILAPAGTLGAQTTWGHYTARFDSYVRDNGVVGASTLLVRDGRIVARHHAGFADRARRQPVDSNTIFHHGSITKTLVAR